MKAGVIYYRILGEGLFWMFTLYSKDERVTLSPAQQQILKQAITQELNRRGI